MKVLTIKTAHNTSIEIHMLNAGEVFENFGGSRHGLAVKKTASLITRTRQGGSVSDVEYPIDALNIWEFIEKCINRTLEHAEGLEAVAGSN